MNLRVLLVLVDLTLELGEGGTHLLRRGALPLHLGKHFSELRDLRFVFTQEGVLGIFVDARLVLDGLCSISPSKHWPLLIQQLIF